MSQYESQPLLSAIVQRAGLKRSGLVADCIFPQVRVPSCEFSYIDWIAAAGELKPANTNLGCKTDVHEVDTGPYVLEQNKLKFQGLSQSLSECCLSLCGKSDEEVVDMVTMQKTLQLQNKLFIGRELDAIALATDEAQYTAITNPETESAEGAIYEITPTNFNDPNYDLLKDFQNLQANNYLTGRRTVAVMSRNKLNALLRHPDFKESGCLVPAISTEAAVASLLGVDRICVADAGYNNGFATVNMAPLWPDEYILLTASYQFITSEDEQRAFGISAFQRGFRQFNWIKAEKGPDAGVLMQKITHDLTPIVLDYKSATLIAVRV